MDATKPLHFRPSRRKFLAGLGALSLGQPTMAALAQTGPTLDGRTLGLTPGADTDQSGLFQAALDLAASTGVPLFLSGGNYNVSAISLPSNLKIFGVPGTVVLKAAAAGPVLSAHDRAHIFIEGIDIDGARGGNDSGNLIQLFGCEDVRLTAMGVRNGSESGIYLENCEGSVTYCMVSDFRINAIHAQNSAGLILSHNNIKNCGNGGIRVWRYENGHDGTIVTGNRVSNILSDSGNGQNGNGINIFRADEVIVSDNNITGCDFSAVRANSTNNTIIRGNICTQSREVAIFSEFAFTGSIIADNLIDQAAQGISITNFSDGGRLAVCSGNIVRNIWPSSPTNPDTSPAGIFAEADTAITGNVVETVPGIGILAGWGPYLRNVLIANNVVRDTRIGIGASVAEGAGVARISGNLIADASDVAIAALAWRDIMGTDRAQNLDQFETLTVENNTVS